METIVYHEYGSPDVLELEEIDKPTVEDTEVLVRVRAASVNPYDWHYMTGLPYLSRLQFGLRHPRREVLGADFAGQVEVVGGEVTGIRSGDEVFGQVRAGGWAEYVSAPGEWVALKPADLTFEQAAAVPMAGLTALQGLRDAGRIESGQKVLINGASGGVGTFAVQLARHFGADVTGVCSTRNLELVGSLGANEVIDYTTSDFVAGEVRYDLIFDLVGNRSPLECRKALTRKGRYIASFGQPEKRVLGPLGQLTGMFILSPFVSQKLTTFVQKPSADGLRFLAELIEAGELTPVIDRSYPFDRTAEAMDYLEEGHARGKVVITL